MECCSELLAWMAFSKLEIQVGMWAIYWIASECAAKLVYMLRGIFKTRWGSILAFLIKYGKSVLPFYITSNEGVLETLSCMQESPALLPLLSQSKLTTVLVTEFLDIHCPVFLFKNISETGLCLRSHVKAYSVGSNWEDLSPYLQTPEPTQDILKSLKKQNDG
jgi:hypothetical protein